MALSSRVGLSRPRGLKLVVGLLFLFGSRVIAFGWPGDRKSTYERPSEVVQPASKLPNVYAAALHELEELESGPLCHRVAARLLVDNCQLLEGKDEATFLTDSGRQLRDFVDAFAASLAICDLERGPFKIPLECAPFRESTLSNLPVGGPPTLHVNSWEIDRCLNALGDSDAAWNTWISYRHSALRFCEAARADNERTQSILLYQRLTKIMAKLSNGVDAELQDRMDDIDKRARRAAEKLQHLGPQINQIQDGLAGIFDFISTDIGYNVQAYSKAARDGIEDATNLQRLLEVLINTVLDGHSRAAAAHKDSLDLFAKDANNEMEPLKAVISSAVASSVALQTQIEFSRIQAYELSTKQNHIEEGLKKLAVSSEALFAKHDRHFHLLNQADNITEDILCALEQTVSLASDVNRSFFGAAASFGWWPYVLCPAASVVMGSYGLAPSAFRNLGLVVLGEAVGYIISSFDRIQAGLLPLATWSSRSNTTFSGL